MSAAWALETTMEDELPELRWTETPRMRCRVLGSSVYFRRLFVSVAKIMLGVAVVFSLLGLLNPQVRHTGVTLVVLAAASFGAFFRLMIEAFPASIYLNSSRLFYNGAVKRGFLLSDCRFFRITPVDNLIRCDFDVPRRRGDELEHITFAAPQSALEYLARLTEQNVPDSSQSAAKPSTDSVSSPIPLSYAPKPVNPFLAALFPWGLILIGLGVWIMALPFVDYFFSHLPPPRLLGGIAITCPFGLIFVAGGVYCLRRGIPAMRQQIERSKQTRRLK